MFDAGSDIENFVKFVWRGQNFKRRIWQLAHSSESRLPSAALCGTLSDMACMA